MAQTHRHSATYRKKGTHCRFGFQGDGKPLGPETTVNVIRLSLEKSMSFEEQTPPTNKATRRRARKEHDGRAEKKTNVNW